MFNRGIKGHSTVSYGASKNWPMAQSQEALRSARATVPAGIPNPGPGSNGTATTPVPDAGAPKLSTMISHRTSSSGRYLNPNDVDESTVLEMSQATTDHLEAKTREKNSLLKLHDDLKKRQHILDNQYCKLKNKADNSTSEMLKAEQKASELNKSNRVLVQELEGLGRENEKRREEVDMLSEALVEIKMQLQQEERIVDDLTRIKTSCHKEMQVESKSRGDSLHALRTSRTAQSLLIQRLEDTQKQSMALKKTVSSTLDR